MPPMAPEDGLITWACAGWLSPRPGVQAQSSKPSRALYARAERRYSRKVVGYTQKIVKKSRTWHRHGGHIPYSMRIYEERQRQARHRRRPVEWFPTVRDLFDGK